MIPFTFQLSNQIHQERLQEAAEQRRWNKIRSSKGTQSNRVWPEIRAALTNLTNKQRMQTHSTPI